MNAFRYQALQGAGNTVSGVIEHGVEFVRDHATQFGFLASAVVGGTVAFLGIREWKFVGPVFPGDTVRVRSKLLEKEVRGRGRRAVLTWQRQIVNQEGKVVQEGTTVTLVECRLPKREGAPTV